LYCGNGIATAVSGVVNGIADKFGTIVFQHYPRDPRTSGTHRTMIIKLRDIAGRHVPFAGASDSRIKVTGSGCLEVEDEDFEDKEFWWPLGEFFVFDTEAKGFLVTLGTGEIPRTFSPGEGPIGSPLDASGWGLSLDNAVTVLVDNEVYINAAELFESAQKSIVLSQLTFNLPDFFSADATKETANVIFKFHAPPPDALNPRAAGVGDVRPERLLLQKADSGVDVRILLHSYELPYYLKFLLGVVRFIFAGSDGAFSESEVLNSTTSVDEAKRYFGKAANPEIHVQGFEQPLFNVGVLHARIALVDGLHGICMGGSFAQGYVDAHDHAIDAPMRGASGMANHDVGIRITGPAVADMHKTMKLFWDKAAPNNSLEGLPRNPPGKSQEGDGLCSIQIVRTLTRGHFENMEEGEKGVLEAYLRAIASAEDFIYLENQYFTNRRIGDALVNVMKRNRDLQVIVLLNIAPDMPLYPCRQRQLINCIREEIGETPDNPRQFGVFTRWSHEPAHPNVPLSQRRPRIMPVYIHSKVGIVDDKWATVGSANLDGLSLDSFGLVDALNWLIPFGDPIGERRAIEVNAVLLNDRDGQTQSDVVKTLRKKLWSECLGCPITLNPQDPNCNLEAMPPGGWLRVWKERSNATLKRLIEKPSDPLTGMASVLPWPSDNTTHKTPRDYLTTLGILPHKLVPIKSTREFDFKKGKWKEGSKANMDYD
jgi:phosphatidylserine/phosphatidylglycerophosphate/cardiolipin synthase-like enzyme